MALKPGAKQAEAAKLPIGWQIKAIREVAPLQRGFDLPNRLIRDGDVPVVFSNGIEKYHNRAMVKGPGVVTGRSGTLGKVHYVQTDYWPHNTTLWVTDFKGNCPKFIYYLYVATRFVRFASGSGVPTLNRNDAHSFELVVPTDPAEQESIAIALSDVDALLDGLDRLIAKKRDLKQAAMQQLLTGETRLPGFEGEWVECKLVELADFYDNLRIPVTESKREIGITPYYGANGIQGYIKGHTHDGEFVLIAEDGANDLNDYPVFYVNGKVWVNNHAHVIQGIPDKTNTKYLSYALKNVNFVQVLVGGTRTKLNGSEAKAIKTIIPSDIEEQTAIAQVLTDMDAEIAALEQRRNKTKDIKQSMMQELLTGKTRLV